MEEKTRQWNKKDADNWEYITTNYARLSVKFESHSPSPLITTDGTWYFDKISLDELIDAITQVREEVYGKR